MNNAANNTIAAIINKAENAQIDRNGNRVSAQSELSGLWIAVEQILKVTESMSAESAAKVLAVVDSAKNSVWRKGTNGRVMARVEVGILWGALNRVEALDL